MTTETPFYQTGGTLQPDSPSYVERQADSDLYAALLRGEFCYVLTSRQMGKSSLMGHTAARLRGEGVHVALVDLTGIGQTLTTEQWYDGLLARLGQQLDLEDELDDFWLDHERLGPLQRWLTSLREVVLPGIGVQVFGCSGVQEGPTSEPEHLNTRIPEHPARLVIFVDEIDAVRNLTFSTDEFFAGIRECYNRRTDDPEFARLTFCLLGVATPSELIQDTRTTPFNIGRRIELTDFTEAEAAPLAGGLGQDEQIGRTLLQRVLYWTGGHPYLTQRLCEVVAEGGTVTNPAGVDHLCEELFLGHRAREQDNNLLFVRERLLRSEFDRASLLDLYTQVRQGKRVPDDETNPLVSLLRLSGVTRVASGLLRVRNRIYERVFDRMWINQNMPDAELRRQEAAYRRGLLRATAVATVVLALLGGLALASMNQARLRRERNLSGRMAQHEKTLRYQYVYATQMNLAQQALEAGAGNVPLAQDLMFSQRPGPGQVELRGFEWGYLWHLAQQDDSRQTLPAESGPVRSLAYSPDGRTLATSGGAVKLWDIATMRNWATLPGGSQYGYRSLAFAPDGRFLAWIDYWNQVRLWDLSLRREAAVLTAGNPNSESLMFSPNGAVLVSSGAGGAARLWEIAAWRKAGAPESKSWRWAPSTLPREWKGAPLCFSPDGRVLFLGCEDHRIRLWDIAAKREIASIRDFEDVSTEAISPDGKTQAIAYSQTGTLALLELTTRKLLASLEGPRGRPIALAFSPDGRKLAAAGGDALVRLYSLRTRKLIATLRGHQTAITCLAFSPDGEILASGGVDETVRFWSTAVKERDLLRGHQEGVGALAVSADGQTLVSGSQDGAVKLWDLPSRRCRRTLKGPRDIFSVSLARDGRTLAFSSLSDNAARVWDLRTDRQIALFRVKGRNNVAYPVHFSPNGRLLARMGDHGAILWDTLTKRDLPLLKGGGGGCVFSPDGRLLATGIRPGILQLWDLATRRVIKSLRSGTDWVARPAFSPDNRLVASACSDNSVHVWNVANGREETVLKGHPDQVGWLGFSPDGRTLATGCHDGTLKFWSIASWTVAATLSDPLFATEGAVFSPDGTALYTGETDGTIRVWRATPLAAAEPQIIRAYHERAANDASHVGDWAALTPHLDWLLEAQPPTAKLVERNLRSQRGNAYGELGQWRKAAADYQKLIEMDAADLSNWPEAVRVELAARDQAGYRRTCAALFRRFGGSPDPDVANTVSWSCALAPDSGVDRARIMKLAERAWAVRPRNHDVLNNLGAAHYRAGRFDAAVRRLNEGIAVDPGHGSPEDWLFLAMSHWRLRHAEPARQYLAKAERAIRQMLPEGLDVPSPSVGWEERVQLQILRREAAALVSPAVPSR